jgi:hypothetical protein
MSAVRPIPFDDIHRWIVPDDRVVYATPIFREQLWPLGQSRLDVHLTCRECIVRRPLRLHRMRFAEIADASVTAASRWVQPWSSRRTVVLTMTDGRRVTLRRLPAADRFLRHLRAALAADRRRTASDGQMTARVASPAATTSTAVRPPAPTPMRVPAPAPTEPTRTGAYATV